MRVWLAVWVALSAFDGTGATVGCPASNIVPAGALVEERFFPFPVERVHDAVADAMQAAGAVLNESGTRLIRGERYSARVRQMRLPRGGEAVVAFLEPSAREGAGGTLLRVETRRPGGEAGAPKQSWSRAVLEQTSCLLTLLGVRDPTPPSSLECNTGLSAGREVLVADGTALTLLLRRFIYSSDLRTNHRLIFEASADLRRGQEIVIPRGAQAVGRVLSAQEAIDLGHGARALIGFESVAAVNGCKIAIMGRQTLRGTGTSPPAFLYGLTSFSQHPPGSDFALPAGTPFTVAVRGDQIIRLGGNR